MAQQKLHHIIVVPGLGDKVAKTRFWLKLWQTENVSLEVWAADWENYGDSFDQKYQRLLTHIKQLRSRKISVSLIGISAGASLAGNIFLQNPKLIHKIINICGRLKMKKSDHLPTLERITFRNKAYLKSIAQFEDNAVTIPLEQRQRIMTFSGMYDELVPINTIQLEGAENRYIPFIGHGPCITLTFLMYKSAILDFLKS